jgi:3-oxoadipate enol-lactonase
MMQARISGIQMSFDVRGSGPAVLLVHGFPFDRSMWGPQVEALESTHRVIAPDLRGFGETEAPAGPYSMDLFANDLAALLDYLGVGRVVLGGLSMGGYIAFAFYRKFPARVRALILSDTRPQPDSPEARQGRFDSARLAREQGAAAVAERLLPRVLSPKTLASKPFVVAHLRRMMEAAPVEGIVGALMAMADRPDSTPTLAMITCPVLTVVGADDGITPPADVQAMTVTIRNARLVTIPDAGHVPTLEQPEAFNAAVQRFLQELG